MTLISDPGITFNEITQPLCIPFETNEDPLRWDQRQFDVLGYATPSLNNNLASGRLKMMRMLTFTQSECNKKLKEKLDENQKCKFHLNKTKGTLVHDREL